MKTVSKTLLEFIGLGAAALLVAVGVNAVRVDGAVKFSKNYFDVGKAPVSTASITTSVKDDAGSSPASPSKDDPSTTATPFTKADSAQGSASPPPSKIAAPANSGEEHLEHHYQRITFEEALALHDDPLTASGLNLFIDARNEERFAEGHISGALLANPYQMDRYIDAILDRVKGAEKIVVYCGGGKCEDSIFLCRELIEMEVPYDSIYLYEGGWKEWSAKDGPTTTGEQ